MKYDIRTKSAPGHREVDGAVFGQYGVHASQIKRDGQAELMIAYFITHMPTGCVLSFSQDAFAGFSDCEMAERIAAMWAEHAPTLGSELAFGSFIEPTPQLKKFADAIIERVLDEVQKGREKCGPFVPPKLQ